MRPVSLVRIAPRTPVVRLPEPLPPEAPPPAALATLQAMADRDGRTYRLPNGFEVQPREKKTRKRRPPPGWWLRGETES